MKIVLATQNIGKLKEFSGLARGTNIKFVLPDIAKFPPETGKTFKTNAFIKAKHAFALTGMPTLADDSGLEVDFLRGKPGVESSRYSEEGTDESNITKLLKEMRGVKKKERTARFKCFLVFIKDKLSAPVEAEGNLEGFLATNRKGVYGFGYDPIFVVKDQILSLAELEEGLKNKISHRSKAFNLLLGKII